MNEDQIKFRFWSRGLNKYVLGDSTGLEIRHLFIAHAMLGKPLPTDAVIEQFTGLLDIDGKEIYVGDIVEAEVPTEFGVIKVIGHMVFHANRAQFGTEVLAKKDGYISRMAGPDEGGRGVVRQDVPTPPRIIGNIHENPELLEVK